ncbi:GntR family transcriptional regulator [Brevibacillus choshinensis]|uniref:GntR family transcriptional regulator n=1 Tax=Brevibacillus choshinensis TaxID=54911 RepID=A0ABX7FTN0_BRECH|nr:GntR family transcriptional regulator [Brevibacillus choshinensis]QRG69068.1 GntR family transcriptional regulator [Brevibacillus choshinensis]
MIEEMEMIDHLIADIHAGKYKANDKLPSENELADLYKVPRMTARKAYNRLQELGYVFSRQGMGSYVKGRLQQIPLVLTGNSSFSKKMIELGYNYESRNIYCEEVEDRAMFTQKLDIDEDDRVFKIGRLRLVDQQPIALHTSFVAESVFPDIRTEGGRITSMYDFYQAKGYKELKYEKTVLSVMVPTKYERELLECTGLIPLLVLESGCRDLASGELLECTRTLYRSDCFTYVL